MISKKELQSYRRILLSQNPERISAKEQELLASGSTAEDIEQQHAWLTTALEYVAKANELMEQGFGAESIEYDQLEKQATNLGSPLPAHLRKLFQTYATAKNAQVQSEPQIEPRPCTITVVRDSSYDYELDDWLFKLRTYASWNGPEYEKKVRELCKKILDKYPQAKSQVQKQINDGHLLRDASEEAYHFGTRGEPQSKLEDLITKIKKSTLFSKSFIEERLSKQYNKGLATGNRVQENEKRFAELLQEEKENPNTDKTVYQPSLISTPHTLNHKTMQFQNIHKNFISQLKPCDSWKILIDETGRNFSQDVFANHVPSSQKGKFVALLVPSYTTLPDLPKGYHTTENQSLSVIENAVDVILSNECGVLGISAQSMHKFNGEFWYVTAETLIDLILRLLPVDNKTHLEICLENRGDFQTDQSHILQKTCDVSHNRLFRTNPHKADKISIDAHIIDKEDDPWNGYVDTIACCWNGSSVDSLLYKSKWEGTCLLSTNPDQLRYSIDSLERSEPLTVQEWNDLITSPDVRVPNSLANILLNNQGEEACADVTLWNKYLEQVQRHLYSKAINLGQLGAQINWLKAWIPEDAKLSPRLRLIWLTTQLAQANHLGKADMITQYYKEFEELCQRIYPEDASLTCLASLHVAVAYMNDYNFQNAYNVIKNWSNVDEAIPGRQYYGQLLSTIGQLHAFTGHEDKAIEFFNKAISRFELLTDEQESKNDINQTSAYKVTTMMDSNPVPNDMDAEMEKYLGRTLKEAAQHFATSESSEEKYMHHIFLRYLIHVDTPQRQELIDEYVSHRTQWLPGFGHPWEMIQYYRALLLTDKAAKKVYLEQAYKQVKDTNGTLAVIACVILGGLYYYDSNRKEELEQLTHKVINSMPNLGQTRVEALQNQIQSPVEPLELAKAVLPFNFR